MRVIAGKAKRLPLKTMDGLDTRPTTDKIKETLFNIISPELYDAVFLDLFSGSGGIGIEALSRGAKEVYFVESNKKVMEYIKENLAFTKLEKHAKLLCMDYMVALKELEQKNLVFDFIFMDPPYHKDFEKKCLQYLMNSKLSSDNTTIIIEAALDTNFDYLSQYGWQCDRQKKYKTNMHMFLSKIKN